ncbi:hypothetical protein C0J52_15561 [Blattella germanica]|nr:hypothetical protein C0J52_15561 [Blattella germanica]
MSKFRMEKDITLRRRLALQLINSQCSKSMPDGGSSLGAGASENVSEEKVLEMETQIVDGWCKVRRRLFIDNSQPGTSGILKKQRTPKKVRKCLSSEDSHSDSG